jgi:hypothetical protein
MLMFESFVWCSGKGDSFVFFDCDGGSSWLLETDMGVECGAFFTSDVCVHC